MPMKTDQHSPARTMVKNSFFLFLSKAQGTVLSIVMFSLTARYLGAERFGLYAVIVAVSMAIRPLVDFGFESIICREISKDKQHASLYVGTTLNVRLAMSLAALAAAYVLARAYSPWGAEADHALMVAVVTELCMSMGITYLAVVRAYERMEWEMVSNVAHKVSSLVLLVVVVYFDMGFVPLFYSRFLPAVVHLAISAGIMYGKFVKFSFRFDSGFARFILKESYPIAIFTVLLVLIIKVDIFMLQWIRGAKDVAIFEVPNRLIGQVQVFAVSVSLSLFPALSRSADISGENPLGRYYRNTYKVLFFAGAFCAGLLFVGGKPLVRLMVGEGFLDAALCLKILAPATVFLFLVSLQNMLLTAIGRQMVNAVTIVVALALNATLDLLLIPRYGYIGASIATIVAYFSLVMVNEYFIGRHGVRLGIGRTLLKISLAAVLMCLPALFYVHDDLTTLALRAVSATVLFGAGLIALKAVTREDVSMIREAAFARGRRRKGAGPPPEGRGA